MTPKAIRLGFTYCLCFLLCLTLLACDDGGGGDDTTSTTTITATSSTTTSATSSTTTTIIPIVLTTTTVGSYSCSAPVRIDGPPADQDSQNPEIAVDAAGTAYAVWDDERNGESQIYFSYCPAGGDWQENELVNDSPSKADTPSIAVNNAGIVFVVWRDMRNGDSDIYFSRRAVDGTWLENERVDNAPEGSQAYSPAIAVDNSSIVYIVWFGGGIWFSECSSGGTWTDNVRIDDAPSSDGVYVGEPDIAVTYDGTVHVVWHDNRPTGHSMAYDIYHSYRTAGGSWIATGRVNTTTDMGYCKNPSIAVSAQGTAYCVWQYYDTDHFDIYYAIRMYDGYWSTDERVDDTPDEDDAKNPRIDLDSSGTPYVVWENYRLSCCSVPCFSYRSAGGWTASTETLGEIYEEYEMDYTFPVSYEHPSIAVSAGGDVHVAWHDFRYGDYDIHSNYRPTGGTWQGDDRVDQPPPKDAQATYPALALDPSGYPQAVWQDTRNGSPDIYFTWAPYPSHFVQTNELVDGNSEDDYAMFPDIAVDYWSNTHAVWQDQRTGDWGIYHAYRPYDGTWQTDQRIDDSSGSHDANSPSIALDASNNAYAVWKDGRDSDRGIYFSLRLAGEARLWQTNERVNDPPGTSLNADLPVVAADADGNCYAVWVDERNGNRDIYFSYRPMDGSWQADERVDDDTDGVSSAFPDIAVDNSGNAHLLWANSYTGGNDIYYSFRPAGGAWQESEKVNMDSPAGSSYFPSVAVDEEGNVYAVWKDNIHSYDPDIKFSFRPAEGVWQDPLKVDIRTFWNNVNNPVIAVTSSTAGSVSIVWQEDYVYPSSWDIMYCRCTME